MEELKKDIQLWYSRLERRGKILLGVAGVSLVWLLFQLINAILNIWNVGLPLNWSYLGWILNILCIVLVGLMVAQFLLVRKMMRDARDISRQMAVRGRKEGNRTEQMMGVRNGASMRKRGNGNAPAVQMIAGITAEMLDNQYRPNPLAKADIVENWMDITSAGFYALESAPKEKVEIIDASALGGGFFIGHYRGGLVKERAFQSRNGEPIRYNSIRNAKKSLVNGSAKPQKKASA